jgi:hypothetical protein
MYQKSNAVCCWLPVVTNRIRISALQVVAGILVDAASAQHVVYTSNLLLSCDGLVVVLQPLLAGAQSFKPVSGHKRVIHSEGVILQAAHCVNELVLLRAVVHVHGCVAIAKH